MQTWKTIILNKSIISSKSDYLLFSDGDCIPRSDFVFNKKDIVVFLAKRDQLSVVENMFRISSF